MRENELRLNERNYEIVKDLSDKDLGILVKALCDYQFTGNVNAPKDKVINAYFKMFKEKIDKLNFYRQTGRIGGIRSCQERQKINDSLSLMLDVVKVDSIPEAVKSLLKDLGVDDKKDV